MISLYRDGELPSPWKEKMQAHLESCSECNAVLSGYERVREYIHDGETSFGNKLDLQDGVIQAAQERVWKKLTMPELITGGASKAGSKIRRPWNWSVNLPLPVAAAAVLVVVISLVFVGIKARTPSLPQIEPVASAGMGIYDQGMIPMHDITEVLQYLSSQDSADFMVIRLPEIKSFSRMGEPELINAADYSRRNTLR